MKRRNKAALFVCVWLFLLALFYAFNPFPSSSYGIWTTQKVATNTCDSACP